MNIRKRFKQVGRALIVGAVVLMTAANAASAGPAHNPDPRTMLDLLPDERALVLEEMRNFLGVLQQISDALARNDMAAVAKAARTMGSGAANQIPPNVVAKLPQPFTEFAGTVHTTFDAMALDAESLGDANHTLTQMGAMMQTCNACHGMYQIPAPRPAPATRARR